MIKLIHNFQQVVAVEGIDDFQFKKKCLTERIPVSLYALALQYPDEILVWCCESVSSNIDDSFIADAFPHNRYFYSYNPIGNFFSDSIGYIEESPFINVNKKVCYPTWQMSSVVGAIKSSAVLLTSKSIWEGENNFDFILSSIAKRYQAFGLFCYSEPRLLRSKVIFEVYPKATQVELFSFIAQHYKWVWKYFLLLCYSIYEKRFPFIAWVLSLFKSQLPSIPAPLIFDYNSKLISWEKETIDVIIPTIGRKKYLYDVLKDLSIQTHLPKNVIIVEQNPLVGSASELDYLITEKWPFQIKHVFTHQTGACQARNKALNLLESKWCFFNDDDNRFDENLIKEAIRFLIDSNINVFSTNYLLKEESQQYNLIRQTTIFGSGNSFIKSEIAKTVLFELKLEFGYGEDTEYGLKLRNRGFDIIYNPLIRIIHLKAPMGGFRTKFIHPWNNDVVLPKPSPTILYVKHKYSTRNQLLGYKMRLFLKTYRYKIWKLQQFEKQWNKSEFWLKKMNNVDK